MFDANLPAPLRKKAQILPPALMGIACWSVILTSMAQSDSAYYQKNLLSYIGKFYRHSFVEIVLTTPLPPGSQQLAAQVRLGGLPVLQTSLASPIADALASPRIELPIRPAGPLEVRIAALDVHGCLRGTGIAQVEANGAEHILVSIRILPASDMRCQAEQRARNVADRKDRVAIEN